MGRNDKALYELRTRLILNALGSLKGKKCLDVGCGDGNFTSDLAKEAEVSGIEYSERAIQFAKRRVPEASFFVMDLTSMKFADKSFDVVTCLDVIEHLRDSVVEKAINELWGVLKVDGTLIISVPSKCRPLSKTHYRHYDYSDITKLLGGRFEITMVRAWGLINKIVVKECARRTKAITMIIKDRKLI